MVSIATGTTHSLAATRNGTVFQWGARTFLSPTPVPTGYTRNSAGVEAATPLVAASVHAGDGVSAALTPDGALFTWGKNLGSGMLGHSEFSVGSKTPYRVEALVGAGVVESASFGGRHAGAVVRPRE